MLKKFRTDQSGQMLVIEAVIFALLLLLCLIFVSQISPPTNVTLTQSSYEPVIEGDDILRRIDSVSGSSGSQLIDWLTEDDIDSLTDEINSSLASFSASTFKEYYYNLSLVASNKAHRVLYNDEDTIGKFGTVTVSHLIICVPYKADGEPLIKGYDGYVYDLVLEMWRL